MNKYVARYLLGLETQVEGLRVGLKIKKTVLKDRPPRREWASARRFVRTFCARMTDVMWGRRQAVSLKKLSLPHLTKIIELDFNAIILVDSGLQIIYVNTGAIKMFGYDEAELIGQPLSVLLPEEFRAGHEELVLNFGEMCGEARMMSDRREIQGLRKNRELFEAAASINAFFEGGRQYYTAVIRDVSRRRQAERDVRHSEERYARVISATRAAIWEWNIDGSEVYFSEPWKEIVGYTPLELAAPGSEFLNLVHADDRKMVRTTLAESMESQQPYNMEFRVHHKDGHLVWLESWGAMRQVNDSSPKMMTGAVVDITRRKEIEKEINLIRSRLLASERIAQAGSWEMDLVSHRLWWSDEVFRIFEVDRDSFGGTFDDFIRLVHPDDKEPLESVYRDSIENGKPFSLEHRIQFADGRVKYVRAACRHEYSSKGVPLKSIGTVQDVTVAKASERALAMAKSEAETANRAKSRFLAAMSHELRTPLNAVIGFAGIMENQIFGPLGSDRYLNYARYIIESGEHLLGIVSNVLDVSTVESGHLNLHEKQIDVAELVSTVLRMFEKRIATEGVALNTNVPDDLPALVGDEQLVRQILINLLSNAIKFSETDSRINLSVAYAADQGLIFMISDNGIGISPASLEKIRKPFERGTEVLSSAIEGTGLGLYLVDSFVRAHGAELVIDSEEGKGTVVSVIFKPDRLVFSQTYIEAASKIA